jgi:hypothetical protein
MGFSVFLRTSQPPASFEPISTHTPPVGYVSLENVDYSALVMET